MGELPAHYSLFNMIMWLQNFIVESIHLNIQLGTLPFTHTHGLVNDEDGRLARRFKPGANWDYNNVGIRLLTDLIPHVTGISIADLLDEKVFRPLGWKESKRQKEPTY